jgi:(5-formylfuran-3-yl)methyl phosphate synthase
MQLMISVVSSEEASAALSGGADILDIKNPAEGSLGANFPDIIREIRALAPRTVQVSAAIGDMPNLPGTAALAALGAASCGVNYVKVGLLGPKNVDQAIYLLRAVKRAVSNYPNTAVIAAGYADGQRAGTLEPKLLPSIARKAEMTGCLLDTFVKDGRRLFDFLNAETLHALADEAHAANMIFALAGSLQREDLLIARDLGADIVGIRSAVCHEGRRSGPLDPERVRALHRIITPKLFTTA